MAAFLSGRYRWLSTFITIFLGPICSAFLTFNGYKQTFRQAGQVQKFGPDQFGCFDVDWIQTEKQISKVYIDIDIDKAISD